MLAVGKLKKINFFLKQFEFCSPNPTFIVVPKYPTLWLLETPLFLNINYLLSTVRRIGNSQFRSRYCRRCF